MPDIFPPAHAPSEKFHKTTIIAIAAVALTLLAFLGLVIAFYAGNRGPVTERIVLGQTYCIGGHDSLKVIVVTGDATNAPTVIHVDTHAIVKVSKSSLQACP